MVKVKKFFILLICFIFCGFFTFSLTGCSRSEVDKVSKNLTEYIFSANLESEHKLTAKMTCNYHNTAGSELGYVCFHLYPRAFREDAVIRPYTALTFATCFPNDISYGDILVSNVRVGGEPAEFEIAGEDEDILKVNFAEPLGEKKCAKIELDFELMIPNCTHRFGEFNGNINLGNWYPIACEFDGTDFDTTPYYATGDPFLSAVANYSVELTHPAEYAICSTGVISQTKNGNTVTSKMEAKAVRDFAMCLSKNSAVVSKDVEGVRVNYMGYATDSDLQEELEVSAAALSYFSKTFGKFPYKVLSVVKTPFIYGGMEYPNLVLVSDSITESDELKKVIVHEIAHQWWYAVVGNNEATEAWLDESLAEYSVALFFENNPKYKISYDDLVTSALSSYVLYVDVIQALRGEVNTRMDLPVSEYQNDYEYSYMIYVKGVIMFDELKKAVGEGKLVAGLKKYYQNGKFKISNKAEFLAAFREACHKDLDGFFEGYLSGTTIISTIN